MKRTVALLAMAVVWLAMSVSAQTKMPLSRVEALLQLVRSGDRTEEQAVSLITSIGVDFELTDARIAQLRASGATDNVLNAIRRVAPQAARPPVVPVTPKGALTVHCAPAECGIRINGQLVGITANGQLFKDGLPLGKITVDFEKEGYFTQQMVNVAIQERGVTLAVKLEPNGATKIQIGRTLFAAALRNLGVQAGLEKLGNLTGSGSATSYADNRQTDLDFDFAMSPPSEMEIAVKNLTGNLVYGCTGETCVERKKGLYLQVGGGKQLRGPAVEDLETNLRAFSQYSLTMILRSLTAPQVQFSAVSADLSGKGEQHLSAETSDRSYDVTIGPDMLPSVVVYQSKSGLGSGLKVTFGDYIEVAGARYPKRTTIRLPDATQHGLEVRLDKITPGATTRKR